MHTGVSIAQASVTWWGSAFEKDQQIRQASMGANLAVVLAGFPAFKGVSSVESS